MSMGISPGDRAFETPILITTPAKFDIASPKGFGQARPIVNYSRDSDAVRMRTDLQW